MIQQFLKNNGIDFEENVSLKEMTTFRVGGKASLVIYPDSAESVALLVGYFQRESIQFFVMGNGSNLLFSDKEYPHPIIKTDRLLTMRAEENIFTFGAGVKLVRAANFAAEKGYTGLEFAHGIPGSIGGAVYMNAGAYDGTMSMVVTETTYVDKTGSLHTVVGEQHNFAYRHSVFSGSDNIVLETKLSLAPGEKQAIFDKMADFMARRRDKQPLSLPSAGSTFKRPAGAFAGKLIEDCGLKGYRFGGAAVSEKHAGFVVNVDNASFEDIMGVITHVQDVVKKETGFTLECEIEIVE